LFFVSLLVLIREGNDGVTKKQITYSELKREVCKFSNGLKSLGIKRGDRIALYMSVSIDLVVAMLSCARIGAIHSVVVGARSLIIKLDEEIAKFIDSSLDFRLKPWRTE